MTEVTDIPAATNGSPGKPPDDEPKVSSRLQELRAAFQEQVANPRLFKRLPAVKGRLVAEYRVLTHDETTEALKSENSVEQDKDTLIAALVALHARDPEHQAADQRGLVALERWLELPTAAPLGFDTRLTEALGLPGGTAREIVTRMFEGNELAIGAQAAQLMAWMTDTSRESLQDFTTGS